MPVVVAASFFDAFAALQVNEHEEAIGNTACVSPPFATKMTVFLY